MTRSSPARLLAEWEPTGAVLMAWPHADTDWAETLEDVRRCYVGIIDVVTREVPVILAGQDLDAARSLLSYNGRVIYRECPNDDTWARDFGPLSTVGPDGQYRAQHFTFNGWGGKFPASKDNAITSALAGRALKPDAIVDHADIVLEGGSIDTDGRGTILTTSRCLLSEGRNGYRTKAEAETMLRDTLGANRVLWLNHGDIPGDDTDGHVDTLARFIAPDTIAYVSGQPEMEAQLRSFRTPEGLPYRLVALPPAPVIKDEEGAPMPATYANFLIINGTVLVPEYGNHTTDAAAKKTLAQAMPHYIIKGVNCLSLIRQHGSLHCATMQLPPQVLDI